MNNRRLTLPPDARSSYAAVMKNYAGQGLVLQQCDDCQAVQYPPRELCRTCFSDSLEWRSIDQHARLLAWVGLMHSFESWFSERLPWCLVSVELSQGPVLLCHGHPDILGLNPDDNATVTVQVVEDAAGCGVLVALPALARNCRTLEEAFAGTSPETGATHLADRSRPHSGIETAERQPGRPEQNSTRDIHWQENTQHGA